MRITLSTLPASMVADGNKITMLTCYDASFAAVLDEAGVDTLLDRGFARHGAAGSRDDAAGDARADGVSHGLRRARQQSARSSSPTCPSAASRCGPAETFRNAAQLMAAGAHMVKIEGGAPMVETVAFLTRRGIPVCGHVGLTPQSVTSSAATGAGQGGRRRRSACSRRRAQAREGRRRHDRAGSDSGRGSRRTSPQRSAFPQSASARASTARGRCSCCTTCSTFIPARRRSSSRTSCGPRAASRRPSRRYVKEVKAKTFPGPEHAF